MVDRLGGGDVEGVPAGVGQALGRSRTRRSRRRSRGRGSRPRRRPRGGPAARSTAPSRPAGSARPPLCTVQPAVQEERPGQRGADAGKRQAQGTGPPVGVEQLRRPPPPAFGSRVERREQRRRRARPQLGVLVEQQAEAPLRLAQQGRVVLRLARSAARARSAGCRRPSARTASAEPSSEALSRTRISRSTPAGWVRSIASRQASRYSRPFVFTTQ